MLAKPDLCFVTHGANSCNQAFTILAMSSHHCGGNLANYIFQNSFNSAALEGF